MIEGDGLGTTHYKKVPISKNEWNDGPTREEPARSSGQCGIKCSMSTCYGFTYVDGVCKMLDSWISETFDQPSLNVFREKIGQYQTDVIVI